MLSIDVHQQAERHTMVLSGELDIATAGELEERAKQLCAGPARELVLDLGGLEFIDSSGLNAILRVRTLCQEHMCNLSLTPGERPVQRLFEVTRLIDRLPFVRARHAHSHDDAQSAAVEADRSGAERKARG